MFRNILIAAAVIPAVWLLVKVYREDRLEPEPPRLLLMLVLMGIVSTILASLTEQAGILLLGRLFNGSELMFDILLYYVVVGLSEEGFKYLVLKKRTWRSPEFNCQFDGVVYAVSVSLGFALWENISYVLRFGLITAMVRAVTAVPGHACFGVFMGVWYGLAKRYEAAGDTARASSARVAAVLVPTLLHGTYDFIASQTETAVSLVFVAFVAVMFTIAYRLVKRAAQNDQYI